MALRVKGLLGVLKVVSSNRLNVWPCRIGGVVVWRCWIDHSWSCGEPLAAPVHTCFDDSFLSACSKKVLANLLLGGAYCRKIPFCAFYLIYMCTNFNTNGWNHAGGKGERLYRGHCGVAKAISGDIRIRKIFVFWGASDKFHEFLRVLRF